MKNLDRIRKEMSPERRQKIETRAAQILAEEMTLRDLRAALAKTQTSIGNKLGIGQEGVSRIERRSDLLLSTLRDYVEAMGGNLSLIVEFADRQPVLLSGIGFSLEKESRVATFRRKAPKTHGKSRETAAHIGAHART
jgi:transcriptional regulator with XRE-family HTH domain